MARAGQRIYWHGVTPDIHQQGTIKRTGTIRHEVLWDGADKVTLVSISSVAPVSQRTKCCPYCTSLLERERPDVLVNITKIRPERDGLGRLQYRLSYTATGRGFCQALTVSGEQSITGRERGAFVLTFTPDNLVRSMRPATLDDTK